MYCRFCWNNHKNLTRVRPSLCPKCGRRGWKVGNDRIKYHFEGMRIGEPRIYPWEIDKCYNYCDYNKIACNARYWAKKLNIKLYIRRHLAGVEVTRIV